MISETLINNRTFNKSSYTSNSTSSSNRSSKSVIGLNGRNSSSSSSSVHLEVFQKPNGGLVI